MQVKSEIIRWEIPCRTKASTFHHQNMLTQLKVSHIFFLISFSFVFIIVFLHMNVNETIKTRLNEMTEY